MKEEHINTQAPFVHRDFFAPQTHSDAAVLNYASSTPAHCSPNALGSGKRGSRAHFQTPASPKTFWICPHVLGAHRRVPACPCQLPPAHPAQPWPQAGTLQGSGSLSVGQATNRLRNSSKSQSPLSPASQRSLMESEGHPFSRINFALWCQSRVVQFIMGFNPCYSRCKYQQFDIFPPAITEIVFPALVSFYSLLWLLPSLSNSAFTHMWCLREALDCWEEGGSSQNRQSRGWCPSISVSTAVAVLGASQGSSHTYSVQQGRGSHRQLCSRHFCLGWRILERNNINGSAEPCSRRHLESLCMPCSLGCTAEGLALWQGAKELKTDTSVRNVHAHFHAVSRYFWQSLIPAAPWVLQSTAPAFPAPIQPPEEAAITNTITMQHNAYKTLLSPMA